ncbi:MAG: hypothetical protein KI785_02445 [Devosiaceae bacterium]|nr:hypothetical protein [Devosiaceae bacterium MH13]
MNLNTFHPLASFDLLAIGIALVVVLSIIGFKILTGRPWRRTLPPDEIDADGFSATSHTRPRAAPPQLTKDPDHDPR